MVLFDTDSQLRVRRQTLDKAPEDKVFDPYTQTMESDVTPPKSQTMRVIKLSALELQPEYKKPRVRKEPTIKPKTKPIQKRNKFARVTGRYPAKRKNVLRVSVRGIAGYEKQILDFCESELGDEETFEELLNCDFFLELCKDFEIEDLPEDSLDLRRIVRE